METFSKQMPNLKSNEFPEFFKVYYFPSAFSHDEIETFKKIAENYPENEAQFIDRFGDPYQDKAIRSSLIKRLNNNDPNLAWVMEKLERIAIEANHALRWNFALSGFYENIQHAKYESSQGGHFAKHYDVAPGPASYRKISISVQLSEPSDYEGGELELHGFGSAPKDKGGVVVFPSFILHRVAPVTKGARESLVAWVSGPPFK